MSMRVGLASAIIRKMAKREKKGGQKKKTALLLKKCNRCHNSINLLLRWTGIGQFVRNAVKIVLSNIGRRSLIENSKTFNRQGTSC